MAPLTVAVLFTRCTPHRSPLLLPNSVAVGCTQANGSQGRAMCTRGGRWWSVHNAPWGESVFTTAAWECRHGMWEGLRGVSESVCLQLWGVRLCIGGGGA